MYLYIYNHLKVILFTSLMYVFSQRDAVSVGLTKSWHPSKFIDSARLCWVQAVAGDPLQLRIGWSEIMVNTMTSLSFHSTP